MQLKDFEAKSHGFWLGILLAVAYFLLMFGNGMLSLTHPDEVFYVQTAKEMVQYKSWLTPMIFDWPQFEKPIFFYWLLVVGIKLAGLSPFMARFWPALFGIIGVAAVYGIAWVLFRNKRTAFLSGMVLAASFIHLAMSRAVLTDMTFSVLTVLSFGSFCWAYYQRAYKNAGVILFFIFMGLAVLTKGLLGVCFPFTVVLSFLISQKDLKFLKSSATGVGAALFVLIAVPWHIVMYQWYGRAFVDEYWHNVHVSRIFVAEHPRNDTWYFYFAIMFAGIMPFSLFWPVMLRTVMGAIRKAGAHTAQLSLLVSWICSTYVFVQIAHSKLASYILPVFPAAAILMGYYLNRVLSEYEEKKIEPRAIIIVGYVMAAFLIAVAVGGNIAAEMYKAMVPDKQPVYIAAAFAVLWAGVMIFLNVKRRYFALVLSKAGVTMLLLTVALVGIPTAEPWVSCKDVMDEFNKIDRNKTPVLASKFYARGVRYYSDRPVAVININGKGFFTPHPIPFLNSDAKVLDFIKEQKNVYAIVRRQDLEQLERLAPGQFRLTEIGSGIGGKHIVKIEKL